jgi:predicted nucleotidyltransferase
VSASANIGIYSDLEAALEGVVKRLAADLDPREIWLLGSRADGRARADSDFDLLVVSKADGAFGSTDHAFVRSPLRNLGVACDVVPCSAEDFEEERKYPHSFVGEIVERGRRVYESPVG